MRMNPLEYHGSKVYKDSIEFFDEAYRIVNIIGVASKKKVELVAYQLKGVSKD